MGWFKNLALPPWWEASCQSVVEVEDLFNIPSFVQYILIST
jgi:hypothetical protein